jgi:hypothetical protein
MDANINLHPADGTKPPRWKVVLAWVWLVAAVAYDVLPADFIPDIPFIGWIDDFFFSAAAIANLIEQLGGSKAKKVAHVVRWVEVFGWLKWVLLAAFIIMVIVAIVVAVILGYAIFS